MGVQQGGLRGARVIGVGHYLPGQPIANGALPQLGVQEAARLLDRTGIAARHIADGETVADLAIAAANEALRDARLSSADVDLVIVATVSATDRTPSTAARVARALCPGSPAALDVNAACAGFLHALALASHSIASGAASCALVIGAEKMSDMVDWEDPLSSSLLGDGAGAFVVARSQEQAIGPVAWGSVGALADAISIEAPTYRFAQEGRPVHRWVVEHGEKVIRTALESANLRLEELDAFVPYQANIRIIDALADSLGLGQETFVTRDVAETANISAASIPVAVSRARSRGDIRSAAKSLLFAVGGGLSYAAIAIILP